MEELTLITEEKEYEPSTSGAELTTVICPICEKPIEVPEYDSVTRSDALKEHIEKEHGSMGNPGEPQVSNFYSLMLHAVAEMYGPGGIVVDEAKARATPCSCVEYKPGKFWCTSPGVVGALSDEQEKIYCNPRKVIDKPGIKERMAEWSDAVEYCRGQLPPVDGQTRLEVYLNCMSKKLTKAGMET